MNIVKLRRAFLKDNLFHTRLMHNDMQIIFTLLDYAVEDCFNSYRQSNTFDILCRATGKTRVELEEIWRECK